MSNDSFKESLLKLGKSSRHPESFRKKELETTGVPGEFRVEYVVFTERYDEYERKIHKLFEKERYAKNREFFTLDLKDCYMKIRLLIGEDIIFEEVNFEVTVKNREVLNEHFPNGNVRVTKSVKDNSLWGGYTEYYNNGNPKMRTNFVRNVENGLRKEFKKDGTLRHKGQMFRGKKQGEWKSFDSFGEETRFYDAGKPVGKWKVHSKQGKVLVEDHGDLPPGCLEKKFNG
jgi:antitoxin component YwqK of YwqJK toxin-antitoxin module